MSGPDPVRRRVAVTGLGVLAPGAVGTRAFLKMMQSSRSVISRVRAFDPTGLASQIAGELPDRRGDSPLGDWRTGESRFLRLARTCAAEAVHDAGLEPSTLDRSRCGVCVATAIGAVDLMCEHFAELTADGTERLAVAAARADLPGSATYGAATAAVAREHGFEGPCVTVTTGCTGGNDALGFAMSLVRRGDADVMVAGAAEAPITPLTVACFDAIGALSVRNDEPSRASRPFDSERDGFVLAEGAGIVVLEELEHARKRGARIYCELTGFGSSCNAFHMTDLAYDGADLARSLSLALEDARRRPGELDYINAHGSATVQNDVCETSAVRRVLGTAAARTPVSSIKGAVGHALAAANALEFVASALAISEQFLPPTLNHEQPGPGCDLDYVPNEAREASVGVLASLSSGFGGIHSTVVLERAA